MADATEYDHELSRVHRLLTAPHGAWSLVRFGLYPDRASGLKPVFPFGQQAKGQICYLPSTTLGQGMMSAMLSHEERPLWGACALQDLHKVPDQVKAQGISGFLAYSGSFQLMMTDQGFDIHHTIHQCMIPDMVGQTLVRHVSFDEEDLLLTYQRPSKQGTYNGVLRWRRS